MARSPWKNSDGTYPSKPCQECGAMVEVKERARWDRTKFCSKACFYAGRELKNTFQPGHPAYYRNPGHSEATKAKLAEINRRNAKRGAEHWAWKGGVSRAYKTGYYSVEYKTWRKAVFNRDDFTCQECGVKGGYLTAHHIKSFAKHPELRFELANGVTLCERCHSSIDSYRRRFGLANNRARYRGDDLSH